MKWEGMYFLFKNSILNPARELVDHRIYTRTPVLNRGCHVFGVRDTVEAAKLFTLHHNDLWLLLVAITTNNNNNACAQVCG